MGSKHQGKNHIRNNLKIFCCLKIIPYLCTITCSCYASTLWAEWTHSWVGQAILLYERDVFKRLSLSITNLTNLWIHGCRWQWDGYVVRIYIPKPIYPVWANWVVYSVWVWQFESLLCQDGQKNWHPRLFRIISWTNNKNIAESGVLRRLLKIWKWKAISNQVYCVEWYCVPFPL